MLEIQDSIQAGPFGFGDIFPELIVNLDDLSETFRRIFDHNWL